LGSLSHALIGHVAGTGSRLKRRVGRRFDLVVDADVPLFMILVLYADANRVAVLLDRRIGSECAQLVGLFRMVRPYDSMNDHLATRAAPQMNIAGAGSDAKIEFAADAQRAVKGGFCTRGIRFGDRVS